MEMWMLVAAASAAGVVLLCASIIVCRIWKRNRYYKKVQHSLDEEERAFQECAHRVPLCCVRARRVALSPETTCRWNRIV